MMPASLKRTSRRVFSDKKVWAEALMMARLLRSRCRYMSWPLLSPGDGAQGFG